MDKKNLFNLIPDVDYEKGPKDDGNVEESGETDVQLSA